MGILQPSLKLIISRTELKVTKSTVVVGKNGRGLKREKMMIKKGVQRDKIESVHMNLMEQEITKGTQRYPAF